MLNIDCDEKEGSLFIRLNEYKVIQDISCGWNVHLGLTEHGVGQMTILNLEYPPKIIIENQAASLKILR